MSCKMFIAKHLALTHNAVKRSDNFSNSFYFLAKLFCISPGLHYLWIR